MDSCEVIVIEDSPPSSPSCKTHCSYEERDFPVSPEHTIAWSQTTTNFIKNTMNSVMRQERVAIPKHPNVIRPKVWNPYLNYNPNNYAYMSYAPYGIYPMRSEAPSQHLYNYFSTSVYFPSANGAYSNAPYYLNRAPFQPPPFQPFAYYCAPISNPNLNKFNQTQLDVKGNNFRTVIPSTPSRLNQSPGNKNFSVTNENQLTAIRPSIVKQSVKNPQSMKLTPLSDATNVTLHDDDDVVFVRAFKNTEPLSESTKSENDKSSLENTESLTDEKSTQEVVENEAKIIDVEKNVRRKSRRKRQTNVIPPRRNPKRQVQIEKEYLKMIDDVLLESKREYKTNKNINNNINSNSSTKRDKNTSKQRNVKTCRRSTRNSLACGAVLCPPNPLTVRDYRDWPVEGMHERPEYDPNSGKIEPFDSYIRNIAIEYKNQLKNPTKQTNSKRTKPSFSPPAYEPDSNLKQTLPELCHEMLHHVFAYVATVKELEDQSKEEDLEELSKREFFNSLNLLETKKTTVEENVCDMLKDLVGGGVRKKDIDSKQAQLRELLENSIILYCFTNNVNQTDVARYIRSIKPKDIIQWSNETFKLKPPTES